MTDPKTPNGPDTPMTLDEAKQRAATLGARLAAERTTGRQHAIRHLADLVQGSGAQAVTPVIDAIAEMIGEAVGPVRDGLRLHVDADHADFPPVNIGSTRCPVCRSVPGERHAFPTCPGATVERRTAVADESVNLGPTRRVAPVAPRGCDDCSVEPGERHRYPTCPGVVRQSEAAAGALTDQAAKLAAIITHDGQISPGRNIRVLQVLAKSLLDVAAQAMSDTYLASDARCRLARAVLDALNTPNA